MSIETARAAIQFQVLAEHYQKETEHLRAVLVHIMLDIEEWRTNASTTWSGTVLDAVEERVKAELHRVPADLQGTPEKP